MVGRSRSGARLTVLHPRRGAAVVARDSRLHGRLVLRRYPGELVMLVLVGLSMLTVLYPGNTQDTTRLALTESVVEQGSLKVDRYHALIADRAYRDGHWYSDKAPGMSFLAVPTVALFDLLDVARGKATSFPALLGGAQLWALRVLTSGLGFLLATLLLGRVAEGLRPGYGAPVAVVFALGTIAGPLAGIMMEHDVSAMLGFASFVAAARCRRAVILAGVLAGLAVLFDYSCALLAAIIGLYVLVVWGRRSLLRFATGVIPAALLLGAYDQAAFGSPFHVSYRYVANQFTDEQRRGFFGVGIPSAHGFWLALCGERGLLVVSPVLAAAAVGLAVMARRGLAPEAAVCLAAAVLFLIVDAGYFDPYGGSSPGPRFFTPGLPFLAVGFADAFRRWPFWSGLLALLSIVAVSLDTLTWEGIATIHLQLLPMTIWSLLGAPRSVGVALELAAVASTTALAARRLLRARHT